MFRLSAARYSHSMGHAARARQTAEWTRSNQAISAYNASVPSGKVSAPAQYLARVDHVLDNLHHLYDFYIEKRRMRRLRWATYMSSQRGLEEAVAMVGGSKSAGKEVLVAFGDATIGQVHGCAPVGHKRLLRALKRRLFVVPVDELRTSMCCSSCHNAMRGAPLDTKGRAIFDGKRCIASRSYGVRLCETQDCPRTHVSQPRPATSSPEPCLAAPR